jgi:euchromatic histone-lysine N-methyltransferase
VEGHPDHDYAAEPDVLAVSAAPCSPRSAPCAEEGQPDDAESDRRRGREWGEGGLPVKKPVLYYERRKRRAAAKATEAADAMGSPFLQREEAVAQDGRKRRTMVPAPMATDSKEMVPMDGVDEADEHGGGEGGGKSARLRVKETLRAFSSYYLHFVQVALFP